MIFDGLPLEGGVGGDDEIKSAIAEDFGESGDLFFIEIGRDFQGEGHVAPGFLVKFCLEILECFEKSPSGVFGLEIAEAGGVGR